VLVAERPWGFESLRPHLEDRFDPAIRIVDHDPAWSGLAEAELRAIEDVLGGVAVRLEHVGSTAVSGLAAKPILDLQVSVDALEPPERYAEPLSRLGYVFVPTDDPPGYPLYAKPRERPRTHHLHVCVAGSEHERRHVAVRDFLRAHPEAAAQYATVKRQVADRHPHDRLAYIEGKDEYMATLEERALAWASYTNDGP
jgi:GrpB-like predicted nucleotidyltransferase (UPF0157 family)